MSFENTYDSIRVKLLEPFGNRNFWQDIAENKKLSDVAEVADHLFKAVVNDEVPSGKVAVQFKQDIQQFGKDQTIENMQNNLKTLFQYAQDKKYSGFFGQILKFFHFIIQYTPPDLAKIKTLSERSVETIKRLASKDN